MGITVSTRFFLDRPHIIKQIGKGRAKALRQAGAIVFRSVRNEFRSKRPSSRGSVKEIGKYKGLPLLEVRKRASKSTRIRSWKTARNPKGFLKTSIQFAYDRTTDSVVVGPRARASWLNVLHEKGGSQTQTLYLRKGGKPVDKQTAFNLKRTGTRDAGRRQKVYVGSFMNPAPAASSFKKTALRRVVRVKKSRYQLGGLRKVVDKLPSQFKNKISGP